MKVPICARCGFCRCPTITAEVRHVRSIWNGAISFGLVSIPIKLVNATESHSVSFRQIHTVDGGRVRYRKTCELDGQEVPQDEIGKGYQEADGSIIPITDDDLASLPIPTTKTIDIVAFVPAERIDPLQMGTAYYLMASGVPAAKPYTLLREALRRSGRVAIAKFALRGRERLGMLRVVDEVIAMHGLLWPDEIRAPEHAAPEVDVTVREAELDLADALMNTLGEVDLADLHDDYREALEELIASKASGEPLARPARAEGEGGKVIDLMAALESSVRAAQASRGEDAADLRKAAEAEETAEAGAGSTTGRAGRGGGRQPAKRGAAKKAATEPESEAGREREPRAVGSGRSAGKSAAQKKTTAAGKATRKKTSATAKTASTAKASATAKTSATKRTAATKETASAKKASPRRRKSA
jgi:DNA end-binding protein Ku